MCELKQKFKEWEEWLFGGDIHSINNQIHSMIWDSAVFQSINEARKYVPKDKEGETQLNGTVQGFINTCFFQTQLLAIRRLLDKKTSNGNRSVVSLYRLVDDVEKHCHLLTRVNILEAHGYPYDYAEAETKWHEEHLGTGITWGDDNLKRSVFSRHMHEYIDKLVCVNPKERRPQDCARKEVFAWLKKRLNSCESIYDYVNKFVAHSATPESRAIINADEISITLGAILDAHKIICQTAGFVGLRILYRNCGGFLAIPQFDQFEHFEKPWATEETVNNLHIFWEEYGKETKKWIEWDWESEFNRE